MSYIQGYENVLIVYQKKITGTKQKNNSFFSFLTIILKFN
jgi:hypothetical protein